MIIQVSRKLPLANESQVQDVLFNDEWLLTNGLGGYASSSLAGAPTRKYHGLLVAALPAPLGRVVILNYLQDSIVTSDGEQHPLSHWESMSNSRKMAGYWMDQFCLENGLPIWKYTLNTLSLEKRIYLVHGQNTAHIRYRLLNAQQPITLIFRPFFSIRHHEAPVTCFVQPYRLTMDQGICRFEFPNIPPLLLYSTPLSSFTAHEETLSPVFYRKEAERGYEAEGSLTSPGFATISLSAGQEITFLVSVENQEKVSALPVRDLQHLESERRFNLLKKAQEVTPKLSECPEALELVLAADQFIIEPSTRVKDMALIQALGETPKTVVAGYHWFTDWGRDTMISLEGLTLITGRFTEAAQILRTFAHYVRDGLIPNMFPDGVEEGRYHSADATLWYIQAIARYLSYTKDDRLLRDLFPILSGIMQCHLDGTRFGIRVDPADGLLEQGADGYALTWMDAHVNGRVITPRRGKAVEINALWYNALCLMTEWAIQLNEERQAERFREKAVQCQASFNQQFWYSEGGYLYDVIYGTSKDRACRPNQLMAISLTYPVLEVQYWESVLKKVTDELLTPNGLRTLSPEHAAYRTVYEGSLVKRDEAYHQGTVWPWLIGPYIDAWLRLHPTSQIHARSLLSTFETHLSQGCIGSINEIFDAAAPGKHRGCVAQAWSVAEVLRSWCRVLNVTSSS